MHFLTKLSAVALLSASLCSCMVLETPERTTHTTTYVTETVDVPVHTVSTHPVEEVMRIESRSSLINDKVKMRELLRYSLKQEGWKITTDHSTYIYATYREGSMSARVYIPYKASKYEIRHSTSTNMDYKSGYIHPAYNRWVERLDRTIQYEQRRFAPPPPKAQPHPMPAPGRHDIKRDPHPRPAPSPVVQDKGRDVMVIVQQPAPQPTPIPPRGKDQRPEVKPQPKGPTPAPAPVTKDKSKEHEKKDVKPLPPQKGRPAVQPVKEKPSVPEKDKKPVRDDKKKAPSKPKPDREDDEEEMLPVVPVPTASKS